jgi:hypothetical protein
MLSKTGYDTSNASNASEFGMEQENSRSGFKMTPVLQVQN